MRLWIRSQNYYFSPYELEVSIWLDDAPLHTVGFSEHRKRNARDRQAERDANVFVRHWKEHEKYVTINTLKFPSREEKRRKIADSEGLVVVLDLRLNFAQGKFGILTCALYIFKVDQSVLLCFSDKKSLIFLHFILCFPIEKH